MKASVARIFSSFHQPNNELAVNPNLKLTSPTSPLLVFLVSSLHDPRSTFRPALRTYTQKEMYTGTLKGRVDRIKSSTNYMIFTH